MQLAVFWLSCVRSKDFLHAMDRDVHYLLSMLALLLNNTVEAVSYWHFVFSLVYSGYQIFDSSVKIVSQLLVLQRNDQMRRDYCRICDGLTIDL